MITHTRSELPCCVERPGVEWPVAPVLRLGEVRGDLLFIYLLFIYLFLTLKALLIWDQVEVVLQVSSNAGPTH